MWEADNPAPRPLARQSVVRAVGQGGRENALDRLATCQEAFAFTNNSRNPAPTPNGVSSISRTRDPDHRFPRPEKFFGLTATGIEDILVVTGEDGLTEIVISHRS